MNQRERERESYMLSRINPCNPTFLKIMFYKLDCIFIRTITFILVFATVMSAVFYSRIWQIGATDTWMQTDWYTARPYESISQLNASITPGALKLAIQSGTSYYSSGTLVSSAYDTGGMSDLGTLSFSSVFEDNFNDGNAAGWTAVSGIWNVESNRYRNLSSGIARVGIEAANFTYSAKIRPESGYEYGIIARYQDSDNYYALKINGNTLQIIKKENGTETEINSSTISWSYGNYYYLKFYGSGNSLQGKIWLSTDSEPSGWLVTGSDSSFAAGQIGLISDNGIVSFDDVSLTISSKSQTNIKFQIKTAKTELGLSAASWYGPTGTSGYYTTNGSSINSVHNGDKWIQYKVILETSDTNITPLLSDVAITFTNQNSSDASKQYESGSNVNILGVLDSAKLRKQNLITDSGFESGSVETPLWTINNYKDNLFIRTITHDAHTGSSSIEMTRLASGFLDTAFTIISPLISVATSTEYTLSYWAKHNLDLSSLSTAGWTPEIMWLDGNQNKISATSFTNMGASNSSWHQDTIIGTSPNNAVYAQIRFGMDNPNFASGQYLRIDDVTFAGQSFGFENNRGNYWSIGNYKNALEMIIDTSDKYAGNNSFKIWSNQSEYTDSAFYLDSSLVSVTAGSNYQLSFWSKHSLDLSSLSGWTGGAPGIKWLDSGQNEISVSSFNLGSTDTSWHNDTLSVVAPTGAVYAKVHFGWDGPDIKNGNYLYLDDVDFYALDNDSSDYYSSGNLISYPYNAGSSVNFNTISWNANTSATGTSVKFQIKTAPNNNGGPGTWTNWLGPDGTIGTYYETSGVSISSAHNGHQWIKYKAFLTTTNASNTPILNDVTIQYDGGSWTNTEWSSGADTTAPTISSYTPTFTVSTNPTITVNYADNSGGTGIDVSSIQLLFDSVDVTNSASVSASQLTYTPSLSVALHTVTLNISDNVGNTTSQTWGLAVRNSLPPTQVTFRDGDNVTLVNGQPFFPMGMYNTLYGGDSIFGEQSTAGFNFAHTYSSTRDANLEGFFSSANTYGIKVMTYPIAQNSFTEANYPTARSVVYSDTDKPALLVWYIEDDTPHYGSGDNLLAKHTVVSDIDPYHPTAIAPVSTRSSRPVNIFYDYIGAPDIIMPQVYPILPSSGNAAYVAVQMDETIELIKEAGYNKPVWPIIQAFGAYESYAGWGWKMPTQAEEKAMIYLGIVHGATGMTWYTYYGGVSQFVITNTGDFWTNLKSIVSELSALNPVLTASTSDSYVSATTTGNVLDSEGNSAIHTLLKEYNGSKYLFAVNSANQSITANFQIAENPSSVNVQFESRTLTPTNRFFSDSFDAYGVHVYSWVADSGNPVLTHIPKTAVSSGDPVVISAEINDDTGIEFVKLHYKSVNSSEWTSVDMENISGNIYKANIPSQLTSNSSQIKYYVTATDYAYKTAYSISGAPKVSHIVGVGQGQGGGLPPQFQEQERSEDNNQEEDEIDVSGEEDNNQEEDETDVSGESEESVIVSTPSFKLKNNDLIKFIDSLKVYVIKNNRYQWIKNPEEFSSSGYQWGNIKEIPQEYEQVVREAILPQSPRLIKLLSDNKVYRVTDGRRKHHVPNPEIFNSYGYNWNAIEMVADEEMQSYPISNLIREKNDTKVYQVKDGKKHWIQTLNVFNVKDLSWDDVVIVNEEELNYYKTSSSIISIPKTNEVITIDGNFMESGWNFNDVLPTNEETEDQVKFSVLYDEIYIYFALQIKDKYLFADDSVEVFINNFQFTKRYNSEDKINQSIISDRVILHKDVSSVSGYNIEIAVPWTIINTTPDSGAILGIEIKNNNDGGGSDDYMVAWNGTANMGEGVLE